MSKSFDSLSDIEIARINKLVEILDKSGFDHLTIELGDFKLTVGTGNMNVEQPMAAPPVHLNEATRTVVPDVASAPAAPGVKPASTSKEGLVEVTAPTMGRFYSRPEPGVPPFVTAGTTVEPDATVGLIEVMKLFNSVSAGIAGTIEEICVEDAELVEYGQVLMRIRPSQ